MDPEVKKQVLRRLTYGLYVVTAASGELTAAGAVNWLSQASFVPPLVMVAIKVESNLHQAIAQSRGFAVNVLAASQQDLAATFFQPSRVSDGRINGYAFERGALTGAVLILDAPAWFEARVADEVPRGDHTVYVAEVVAAGMRDPQAKALDMWDTKWVYGG